MNAVEIKNLTKSYSGFTLDGLSLTLPEGCIMGLIGENGAGKSTTLKLILNMIRKDGGSVTLFGEDSAKFDKNGIGVVPEDVGIPECLTSKQVGRVMSRTFESWDGNEYSSLLKKLSLPEDRPFKDFSRGMKMKLGIAVALAHNARLLLLDEPTAGLDPVARDEVVDMLMDFARDEGRAVLISSHIVSDLEKLCDYIAFLHKGRLLLCEEKDRLLAEYGIVHCTRGELRALPPTAVRFEKENQYGAEALVLREFVPRGVKVSPVTIEELFVFTVKEAE